MEPATVRAGQRAALKLRTRDRPWVRTEVRVCRQAKLGSKSESGCRAKVKATLESAQGFGGQEMDAGLEQVCNVAAAKSEWGMSQATVSWNKAWAKLRLEAWRVCNTTRHQEVPG